MTTHKSRKRNQLLKALQRKEARDAYVESHVETGVAFQIKANRLARQWTQKVLGKKAKMKQPMVSRLEGTNGGLPSLESLLKLASAFDVALIVRFVPFGELLSWTQGLGERDLVASSFDDDQEVSHSIPAESTVPAQRVTFSGDMGLHTQSSTNITESIGPMSGTSNPSIRVH